MFLSFEKNNSEIDEDKKENPYLLTAVSKTVVDIEDFLRKRWKSYKDVNYHHSVHKSELLMRSILIDLAESSHMIPSERDNEEASEDLPDDFIQGILQVLRALKIQVDENKISEAFLRLDDAWLDTLIKKSRSRSDMVDELAYGRTSYQSLIKRFEDFFKLDEQVYCHLKDAIAVPYSEQAEETELLTQLYYQIEDLISEMGDEQNILFSDRAEFLQDVINETLCSLSYRDYKEYVFSNHFFLINYIIESLDNYLKRKFPTTTSEHPYKNKFFHELTNRLNDEFPIVNNNPQVMIGAIYLNSGIQDNCIIRGKDDGLESFRLYSGLKEYLLSESMMHPAFHFYCKVDANTETVMEKLSSLVYHLLKEDIVFYAKELIQEIGLTTKVDVSIQGEVN